MHLSTTHDFPGRKNIVTVTAFIEQGSALPMKPVAEIVLERGGAISCEGENLTIRTAVRSNKQTANTARQMLEAALRKVIARTAARVRPKRS